MSIQPGYTCITAPIDFSMAKFAARYALTEDDYELLYFNGEPWIKVSTAIAERIGPHPVFEP